MLEELGSRSVGFWTLSNPGVFFSLSSLISCQDVHRFGSHTGGPTALVLAYDGTLAGHIWSL